jgi:hypothetical protein
VEGVEPGLFGDEIPREEGVVREKLRKQKHGEDGVMKAEAANAHRSSNSEQMKSAWRSRMPWTMSVRVMPRDDSSTRLMLGVIICTVAVVVVCECAPARDKVEQRSSPGGYLIKMSEGRYL